MSRSYKVTDKYIGTFSHSDKVRNANINIQKNFNLVIRSRLTRRINLIGQSIAGSFLAGNDPKNVSFRHILNRVMLLIQVPFFFIIYEKEDEGGYHEHYRSTKNPQDQLKIDEFSRCIESADRNSGGDKKHLIQLFGSKFYLLPILVGKNVDSYTFEIVRSLGKRGSTPSTTVDLISYVLGEIFNEKNYETYGSALRDLLIESIVKCKDGVESKNSNESKNEKKVEAPQVSDVVLREVFERFDSFLLKNSNLFLEFQSNGYLDRIYKKMGKNLKQLTQFVRERDATNGKPDAPANYVIFLRDYAVDEKYRRHANRNNKAENGYNYRIRIALCERQKEDIRSYFFSLKKEMEQLASESKKWPDSYVDGLKGNYKNEKSNIYLLAKSLDEWFWKELLQSADAKNKNTAIEKFIEILGSFFGDETRSAADPVFDGITYFRRPFSDGGILRCFPHTKEDGSQDVPYSTLEEVLCAEQSVTSGGKRQKPIVPISDDLKRLVISYYWYQGMLPNKEENHELAIMLTPIELGGSVWAVTGYFSQVYKVKDDDVGDEEEKKKLQQVLNLESQEVSWNQCYHLYQDMNARFKKELRHGMANCHMDLLAYFYAQSLSPAKDAEIFGNSRSNSDRTAFMSWLNERFAAVTRFLPYSLVSVEVRDGEGTPSVTDNETQDEIGAEFAEFYADGVPNLDYRRQQQSRRAGARKAGAYLTRNHHCSLMLHGNPYFPPVLGEKERGAFLNKRDLQEKLSDVALHPFTISDGGQR